MSGLWYFPPEAHPWWQFPVVAVYALLTGLCCWRVGRAWYRWLGRHDG
jgi:hypothetical protein